MSFYLQLAAVAIAFGLSMSAEAFAPQDICSSVTCTEPMKAIAEKFKSTVPVQVTTGSVYSGVCYYLTMSISPNSAHAGLATFLPVDGKIRYKGLFSFFGKPSNFAGLDFAAADKQLGERKVLSILQDRPNYSGFQNINGSSDMNYWFGMSPDQKELTLLSVWIKSGGITQVAFCQMNGHQ